MDTNYPVEKQGFFVKINNDNKTDSFKGPFAFLSEARSEARIIGPNLEIFHGVLKFIDASTIDSNKLFLVKKLAKS